MDSKIAVKQLQTLKKYTPDGSMRLAAEWNEKWKILIATILSAQTRDETTIQVGEILFKKYPTLDKFRKAKLNNIEKIIRPINYYKTKAKNILATAKLIYRNGIPENCDELLEFPGVGRKVANVYLAEAFKADAIGVDTHLSFVSQYLEWSKNKNPHKIEKDLESLFPKKYWNSINYIVVRFGRSYNRQKQSEILDKLKII
ncbi:MAG: endonuclease III [Nanoarchaeota archaeon]|nr:endonuclease III [Nanoarchaeota archaeon]